MPLVADFDASSTISLHSSGDSYINTSLTDSPERKRSLHSFAQTINSQAHRSYSATVSRRMRGSHRHRRSSLDWQLSGSSDMSRRVSGGLNFSAGSRGGLSGAGVVLTEQTDTGTPAASIQTHHHLSHPPLSQTFTAAAALDYDMQNVSGSSHTAQTYAPFALLTGPQCIPVCCAATMTTAAHLPVTAWTYPAACPGAAGVQLIPCCDGTSCANHHMSAAGPRQFYGIGPYHCPPYRHHHHHSRHRLSTPSIPAVPLTAASVYQPHHVPSTSMVAPASMFTSQQQPGPSSQTVYHNQQSISHAVYQSSALLNRAQSDDAVMADGGMTNVPFASTSSAVYHQQRAAAHATALRHHHTALTAQPLLLQPLASTDFINGTTLSAQQYRPLTSTRQHGWQTYQTVAAPYPAYLLHFLTMLGHPPATAVMSTSLSHHQQAALHHHDDMAAAAAAGDLDSYEALLNLAERLGDVKSRGLSRSDIDRLRCYRYSGNSDSSDDNDVDQSELDAAAGSAPCLVLDQQTSCVVCLCEFEPRELVRALPCQHEFHANCVDRWLKMNRTCPLCRADVTELMKMDVD